MGTTEHDRRRERIGFIGLGQIGLPMCAQVLRAGYAVTAFDLRADAVEAAVAQGATGAASAAACAAAADLLVTVVPGPAVEDVLLGSGGALAALAPGGVAIDMSTGSVPVGRRVAAAAAPPRGRGGGAPPARAPPAPAGVV